MARNSWYNEVLYTVGVFFAWIAGAAAFLLLFVITLGVFVAVWAFFTATAGLFPGAIAWVAWHFGIAGPLGLTQYPFVMFWAAGTLLMFIVRLFRPSTKDAVTIDGKEYTMYTINDAVKRLREQIDSL